MSVICRPTAAILLIALLTCGGATAQDTLTRPSPQTPSGSAGWTAYLDPSTGKLVDRPAHDKALLELSKYELYMFTTDDFGLIERKMPDGGYAMDLEGRFRQGTVATVGENGEIKTHRIGGNIFASPAGKRIRDALRHDMREGGDGEGAR